MHRLEFRYCVFEEIVSCSDSAEISSYDQEIVDRHRCDCCPYETGIVRRCLGVRVRGAQMV